MPRRRRPAAELDELKAEYLYCRVLGHAWDDVSGLYQTITSIRGDYRHFRCTRCGTIKFEAWNPYNGFLLLRQYTYPDGYSEVAVQPPEGLTARQYLRTELLARERFGKGAKRARKAAS